MINPSQESLSRSLPLDVTRTRETRSFFARISLSEGRTKQTKSPPIDHPVAPIFRKRIEVQPPKLQPRFREQERRRKGSQKINKKKVLCFHVVAAYEGLLQGASHSMTTPLAEENKLPTQGLEEHSGRLDHGSRFGFCYQTDFISTYNGWEARNSHNSATFTSTYPSNHLGIYDAFLPILQRHAPDGLLH